MAAEKLTVIVPDDEMFKPAPIPFAVVTGEGVDNYNKDGKEYTASIVLDKKQAKHFKEQVLDYWADNAPKGAGEEPDNFNNIVRKGKDDYEGKFLLYAKTQTQFDGRKNDIPIVDGTGAMLDPEKYGLVGKGSEGRLAVTLSAYVQGRKTGVSVFLNALKLTEFKKLESKGGASAFKTKDEGSVKSAGGFKPEKEKKKKKDKK